MFELVAVSAFDDGHQHTATKKSKVFHEIACDQVVTFNEENFIYFQSLEETLASGRRGYKACKPKQ